MEDFEGDADRSRFAPDHKSLRSATVSDGDALRSSASRLAGALYLMLVVIGCLYVVSCWPPAGPAVSVLARVTWAPIAILWILVARHRSAQGHASGAGLQLMHRYRARGPGGRSAGAGVPAARGAFGASSPRWVQAVGLLSIVSGLGSLAISPGTPSEVDGEYFIRNKATVVTITRDAYPVAAGWQARAFLSIGAFFTVLVIFYLQDTRPPPRRTAS